MSMNRIKLSLALVVLLVAIPSIASTGTTLDNLQAAFNGESNANAKYLAYATKADAEGYKGAASLFRAAAKAEEIHAANHAEVIKSLNAVPQKKIELPPVGTTAENLKDAIKGETYERDVMYPDFLKVARADKNMAAIRTFNLALQAEAEHAKLYTNASKNQESMKAAQDFYVCTVCGYTTANIPTDRPGTRLDARNSWRCPKCGSPKDKFVKVA